ncbi:MAG: glycosyltransferase [Acidimicrobiia bacterium]|nr:glycosyltransferase [Acidimicrobiia bacterium]
MGARGARPLGHRRGAPRHHPLGPGQGPRVRRAARVTLEQGGATALQCPDSPPLVSVVMIFFQAERFIGEAIESVLAQTLDRLELLLVDDGSTDAGPAIAEGVAARDRRARVVRHPDGGNHGMSAARNLGVREAQAGLVAFVDADDVWEPGHLEHQVGVLEAHPGADLVGGRALYWRSWGDPAAPDDATALARPPGRLVRPPEMLIAYLDDGWTTVPTCSLLVRKEAFLSCGGSEESFGGMFEDTALLSKLYLRGTAVLTEAVTARYRQHPESACAVAARSGRYRAANPSPSRRQFMEWLDGYLRTSGSDDPRLLAAVQRELAPYRPAWKLPVRRAVSAVADRARATLPDPLRRAARTARGMASGAGVGHVRFGSLRRLEPVSRDFGFVRGQPIDRHYIEQFLAAHAEDVRGRVLEVGDDAYTRRFGGPRVASADVLHVHAGDERASFVGDLAEGGGLPADAFDCIVVTQTLHLVYDLAAAVRALHRALRPGGVLLATVPGISQLSADEWRHDWYWSLAPPAVSRLLEDQFGGDRVDVRAYGNVLAATSFLHGISAGELRPHELDHHDPQFPMVVAARSVKGEPGAAAQGAPGAAGDGA